MSPFSYFLTALTILTLSIRVLTVANERAKEDRPVAGDISLAGLGFWVTLVCIIFGIGEWVGW